MRRFHIKFFVAYIAVDLHWLFIPCLCDYSLITPEVSFCMHLLLSVFPVMGWPGPPFQLGAGCIKTLKRAQLLVIGRVERRGDVLKWRHVA